MAPGRLGCQHGSCELPLANYVCRFGMMFSCAKASACVKRLEPNSSGIRFAYKRTTVTSCTVARDPFIECLFIVLFAVPQPTSWGIFLRYTLTFATLKPRRSIAAPLPNSAKLSTLCGGSAHAALLLIKTLAPCTDCVVHVPHLAKRPRSTQLCKMVTSQRSPLAAPPAPPDRSRQSFPRSCCRCRAPQTADDLRQNTAPQSQSGYSDRRRCAAHRC